MSIANNSIDVYDTTLRDGTQQEGINLSITDKLAIAVLLDQLGVGFIEGGWPGAIPKDTEFFARARNELNLQHAVLAAFGATRKADTRTDQDEQVLALLAAETPMVTLVAKSDSRHVEYALRTTNAENLAMISDTVKLLVKEGRRVVVDAEHFFDGYRFDPKYALEAVIAAFDAGAETVCLCDTNGGMVPDFVSEIVGQVHATLGAQARLGIHAHNDAGCAIANSLAAINAGAQHVQGTVNGYGERTGNADLIAVVANLNLKYGFQLLPGKLGESTRIAHTIAEIVNIAPFARQPYVGLSAFAHKAGLHASAIKVHPDMYQHADPAIVGNDMRMLVSEMAGRASVELKGRELGFDLSGQKDLLTRVTKRVKDAEANGYTYDAADASFELMLREEQDGERPNFFTVDSWRAFVETVPGHNNDDPIAEATVKIRIGGRRIVKTAEGNGPVNALDAALREALIPIYPEIETFALRDYKVRIMEADFGTDSTTRVLITTASPERYWRTVGVGTNVIEASWEALIDGYTYGLMKSAQAFDADESTDESAEVSMDSHWHI
ncbi:MAG: citramalate synthase [Cellulomonadaceae bacterium]|jgi:2-isopropylmalate synthase|nr:citramalate synthase [Cellulomonadaceae bacterium]